MASVDIASALGVGSGINTTQLVSDLVAATRDPKEKQIDTKQTTNNARISALASAKGSLATFSSALTELLKSSSYSGQPVSNDATIASVSLISGATGTPKLPAQIEVRQLASAQVLQSDVISSNLAIAGNGTLTFTTGTTSFDVTIATPNNNLDNLAKAINDKAGGITASVVTDSSGARLVLKGDTGAAKAFTVSTTDGDANLQRFVFNGTSTPGSMTKSQNAQNALISVDNVDMSFATNEITTAIPFLRIDLNSAKPGTKVTLATNQPTATMADLVGEFVQAYNNVKTALNDATKSSTDTVGLLSSDPGVREMANRLAKLSSTKLASTGTYQTLSDLGVSTNRDGTLTLDTARLNKALQDDPAGITQMLNPTTSTAANPGIGGAMKSITDFLNATNGPLASSAAVYDKMKTSLAAQLTDLNDSMTKYSDQLTKTYSAMQTQLLALKSTQTYLTQQISVWTNSNH